jgi:pescadillo protein
MSKVENVNMSLKKQADEEKKLSEMMITKKNKRLYNKIMYSKKKQKQEVEKLKEKREKYEASKNQKSK